MSTFSEQVAEKLPISMHEYMLGVDITIHARRMHHEINDIQTSSGLSPEPQIYAVGSGDFDLGAGSHERTYLAAWARRNLFREGPA